MKMLVRDEVRSHITKQHFARCAITLFKRRQTGRKALLNLNVQ